jgi:elongation factor P
MQAAVMFFRGRAINVDIPQHVVLKITYCEPGVRGDTATNVTKPATLETGAIIAVPLFINEGDKVKVDTRSGEYLERTSIG